MTPRCAASSCLGIRGAVNGLGVCDGCCHPASVNFDPPIQSFFDEPFPGAL